MNIEINKVVSCTKKIEFDAAHRIVNHQGACRMLHGHRYVAEITFSKFLEDFDDHDMVIDFIIIKQKLDSWIKQYWDHNTILSKQDKNLGDSIEKCTSQTVFYLEKQPTAENMAIFLMYNITPKLFEEYNVKCTRLKLRETPSSFVEVTA
ncbi:6-pyruvoyl trahydropterin synthase family protein [Candidatus Fokinia crypta]|uniref:6-carboxy-5,6,7,8-tetrahydropterin synthase n=1 Tax=Candidatus Fokinia crypta TaxID=1920990 RepID=A0ABZ0UNH5_9RICK|nr:6-carboxytetrahydropterin synthase [Candidatus Fokinia cryptica]WPX97671.1 6-pyruvoyl tetrahydropterin synthase [Candidatus Fokinia cryptica]